MTILLHLNGSFAEAGNTMMSFYTKFAQFFSNLWHKKHKFNQNIFEKDDRLNRLNGILTKCPELVECLNNVIFSVSLEGRFTNISPSVKTILGYNTSELIGQNFRKFIHKDDLTEIQEAFKKIVQGKLEASKYRFRTKDRNYLWVRSSIRPILRNGKTSGIQGVITRLRRFAISIIKSKKKKSSIARTMRALCFNTRAVFDYLKMTRNSCGLTRVYELA